MKKASILICLLIVAACAPSEDAVRTAIAETQAANPTNTKIPTDTQTATPSLTPTRTPTKTPLPTFTPTATHQPETLTIIAATETQKSIDANSTATAAEISAQATRIARYVKPETKELVTYPENYDGEYIKVRGRVFNINSNQEFQFWIDGGRDAAAYIVMDNPYSDIYEDTWVTVYGVGAGENCGQNAFGAEICQPLILGEFYELK